MHDYMFKPKGTARVTIEFQDERLGDVTAVYEAEGFNVVVRSNRAEEYRVMELEELLGVPCILYGPDSVSVSIPEMTLKPNASGKYGRVKTRRRG